MKRKKARRTPTTKKTLPARGKKARPAVSSKRFEPEVLIAAGLNMLHHDIADLFVQTAREAVAKRGRFLVALSGGTEPVGLFRLLATEPYRSDVPWDRTYVVWGDDRHVPLDHPDSNYKMALDLLLSKVEVSPGHLYPMTDATQKPEKAAADYEKTLKHLTGAKGLPVLDFNLMGMGPDGHTASLFPQRAQLTEKKKWVIGYWVDKERKNRVTMTFPVLNASRLTVVLIDGPKKANLLKTILEGQREPDRYPIQHLKAAPGGRLLFALDNRAAMLLSKKPEPLEGS